MDNKAYIVDHDFEKNDGEKKALDSPNHEDDPWKVTSLNQTYVPWSELTRNQKIKRLAGYGIKIVLVLGFLYLFICSLDFLSSAFRLLGGETAGRVFQQNDIMSNPIAGLMMGVLVTVLVQSSSTSTSIIVSMVGADLLSIKTAIPIVMGANIGTSVTNTIVAIGQISDKGEFRRAFAGATVHDMFNWLTVIILLPIEVATDYLYHLSDAIVSSMDLEQDEDAEQDILKVITEPFTKKIVQVNKKAITNIAKDIETKYDYETTVLKICCDKPTFDKSCNNMYKDLKKAQVISYNAAQKQEFCESTKYLGDVAPTPYTDAAIDICTDVPWGFETVEAKDALETINCAGLSTLQNITLDESCCNSFVGDFMRDHSAPRDWTRACTELTTSCSASGVNFMSKCQASIKNETRLETFDCYKWVTQSINKTCQDECSFLFRDLHPKLNDKETGAIVLIIALFILCVCLVAIVKLLHSILQGPMATMIKKFVNADFPGYAKFLTGYIAILIGAGLTFVVQSSSIFTSTLTPLVGIGVIEIDRMYPLTLGSNIGTTTTAILAALASSDHLRNTLQVAFCHLFFNITGILIFYPLPFLRFPIPMAKFLGNRTANYRWFAILYIIIMFFALPATIFALSIPGWYVLLGVAGPFALVAIIVVIIKILQAKKPSVLPAKLRDWKFLPKPMRSLEPYDEIMQKVFFCSRFQNQNEESLPMSNGEAKEMSNGGAQPSNGHGHQYLTNTKL